VVAGWPSVMAIPFVLACALAVGAAWIAVPVLLKVRFGVLEVITTLLLNFVALQVVSWMVTGPLQESARTYPQSDPVAAAARLRMLPGTRLHLGFFIGLLLAGSLWFLLRRTVWGFKLRAVGAGPRAAEVSGRINSKRMLGVALLWSGAI